jgi:hypothetical protein
MAAPTPSANGNWFYNKNTGQIQHITSFLEKMVFEAESWEVSFNSEADARAYKTAYEAHKKNPGSPSPVKDWWFNPTDGTIFHGTEGEMSSPWIAFSSKVEAQAYLKAHPPTLGLPGAATDISGFLSRLTSPNTWIRVAEVLAGALLLAIGISAMIKQTTGVSTAQVAKVAML